MIKIRDTIEDLNEYKSAKVNRSVNGVMKGNNLRLIDINDLTKLKHSNVLTGKDIFMSANVSNFIDTNNYDEFMSYVKKYNKSYAISAYQNQNPDAAGLLAIYNKDNLFDFTLDNFAYVYCAPVCNDYEEAEGQVNSSFNNVELRIYLTKPTRIKKVILVTAFTNDLSLKVPVEVPDSDGPEIEIIPLNKQNINSANSDYTLYSIQEFDFKSMAVDAGTIDTIPVTSFYIVMTDDYESIENWPLNNNSGSSFLPSATTPYDNMFKIYALIIITNEPDVGVDGNVQIKDTNGNIIDPVTSDDVNNFKDDFDNKIPQPLTFDSSGRVKVNADIVVEDIEIGAVEIKDGSSDTRAKVDTDNAVITGLNDTSGNRINPATEDTLTSINNQTSKLQYDNYGRLESARTFQNISYTHWNDLPLVNTELINPITDTATGESIGSGDGSTTSFTHTAANLPIVPKSISISYTIGGTNYTATDDGEGNITGTDISSGSVNYDTGSISLTFSTAPDDSTTISMNYSYFNNGNTSDVSNAIDGYIKINISGITTSSVYIIPVIDGVELEEDKLVFDSDTNVVYPVKYVGGKLGFKAYRTGNDYITLTIEEVSRE